MVASIALPTMRLVVDQFPAPTREYLPRRDSLFDSTDSWIEVCDKQKPVGELRLYLKPVLSPGEIILCGSNAQKRMIAACEAPDILGFVHAWHLFEACKLIPPAWRDKRLLFPASLWRNMSCDCRGYSPEFGCSFAMNMDKRFRCDTVFFCVTGSPTPGGGLAIEPRFLFGHFLEHDFLVCAKAPDKGRKVD